MGANRARTPGSGHTLGFDSSTLLQIADRRRCPCGNKATNGQDFSGPVGDNRRGREE